MIKKLYCDLETFSPIPLKNGTHAYAEQAEVMHWLPNARKGAFYWPDMWAEQLELGI